MKAKTLYVDMDNVLVDFRSGLMGLPANMLREYQEHEDDIPGIFSRMMPMPGAIQAFNELTCLFDTYILSTAPWRNPSAWSDKVIWIQKYLGEVAHKRLILTHHKDLNQGDFLIDDRLKHGVDRFRGEHIHFGSEQFPNWSVVTGYLRSRA